MLTIKLHSFEERSRQWAAEWRQKDPGYRAAYEARAAELSRLDSTAGLARAGEVEKLHDRVDFIVRSMAFLVIISYCNLAFS